MAQINLINNGYTGINWNISGLGNYWRTTFYTNVTISTSAATNGGTVAPAGILQTVSPTGTTSTSYTTPTTALTGLLQGKAYVLYGTAKDKAVPPKYWTCSSISFTTSINPPSGVSASTTSNTSCTVSWNAITNGATNYTVQYSLDQVNWTSTTVTTSTSKIITGLTAGQLYYFQVRSNGPTISSLYSASVSAPTRPNTPTITSCTQYPSGTLNITVNWGNTTSGATYFIQARTSGTTLWFNKSPIGVVGVTTFNFPVNSTGNYDVNVYATKNGVIDPSSGSIVYNIPVTIPPPAEPVMEHDGTTTTTFAFHWLPVSGATAYYVYKNGVIYDNNATSPFTVTGLTPGVQYTIELSAYNGSESTKDSMIGYTLCTAPTNLALAYRSESVTGAQIFINWTASANASSYLVYCQAYGETDRTSTPSTNSTGFTGLSFGVEYTFTAYAVNGGGFYSAQSTSVNIYTAPQTPTISIGAITSSSIQVLVDDIVGNHDNPGIRVYYGTSPNPSTNYVTCNPTGYYTFTGLSIGTTYYYQAKSIYLSTYTSVNYSNKVSATPSTRPSDWTGFTWIVPGAQFATNGNKTVYPITAALWNQFTDRVSQFRAYKGIPYTFTSVSQYSSFSATVINNAITKVNDMISNPALYIPSVSGTITAQTFIDLQARLNEL